MKDRYVEGFKPCPLCGKTENLMIAEKEHFYDSAIHIECAKCNLDLWDFTFSTTNYDKRIDILRKKWNRRRRNNETE